MVSMTFAAFCGHFFTLPGTSHRRSEIRPIKSVHQRQQSKLEGNKKMKK